MQILFSEIGEELKPILFKAGNIPGNKKRFMHWDVWIVFCMPINFWLRVLLHHFLSLSFKDCFSQGENEAERVLNEMVHRVNPFQCDQMARLFAQYWAICYNENWPNRIIDLSKKVKTFAKFKINPQNGQKRLKFWPSGKFLSNMVTLISCFTLSLSHMFWMRE